MGKSHHGKSWAGHLFLQLCTLISVFWLKLCNWAKAGDILPTFNAFITFFHLLEILGETAWLVRFTYKQVYVFSCFFLFLFLLVLSLSFFLTHALIYARMRVHIHEGSHHGFRQGKIPGM